VALEFLPPVTAARHFDKDKYLEPMFGDVGQARTKARICRTADCYYFKAHLAQNALLGAVLLKMRKNCHCKKPVNNNA